MKKQQYIQPQSVVESLSANAAVMLLGSGTGLEPGSGSGSGAPARPNIGAVE